MKMLKIHTLKGPNYWSVRHHKLIVMLLDLEDLTEKLSNQIPGFFEGLTEVLPSLAKSGCPDYWNKFLIRVREGMTIAPIVERVALVLQELAGMAVGFGRTRAIAIPGIYQVAVEYLDEQAGRYAVRAAIRLCRSVADTGRYPQEELEQDLRDLKELWAEAAWGPSTEALIKEAEVQGIPWMPLSARSIIQLGYGKHQQRIQATLSDRTGILAVELASDKESTKEILKAAGIPVPQGRTIRYLDELAEAVETIGGFPIVIKPLDGNHGRGITLNIDSWELAEAAYDAAKDVSREVIVEHYYPGRDHRVLVVGGKVVAVAERVPANVVGDGKSTIEELVEQTNQDPQRGEGHENVLTQIELNQTTRQLLRRQGYTLDTVLPNGEVCYLQTTANLSTGGIAIDRTDEIHPENIWMVQRAAKIIGLDIAGIDIVTSDISRPLREVDGAVIEVNAAPGLRMHVCPSQGTAQNVAKPVLDMLFPAGTPSRIPIIAVTGAQSKTRTTRLTAHIFQQAQQSVGCTTTDGIYINDYLVSPEDGTGPQGTQLILQDPTVEVAVLETAQSGILRSGLGFSACNIGVVLDVAVPHSGNCNPEAVKDLAHLERVVAESVMPNGYVVLNADDPAVATMAQRVSAQVAYFTLNPENELVQAHIQQGGLAATYENGYLSILKGDSTLRIEPITNVPSAMNGQGSLAIAPILAASLAAFVQGVGLEEIRVALITFEASGSQTPGQISRFDQETCPPEQEPQPLVVQQTSASTSIETTTKTLEPLTEVFQTLYQSQMQLLQALSKESESRPKLIANLQERIASVEQRLKKPPQLALAPELLSVVVKRVKQEILRDEQTLQKEQHYHHHLRSQLVELAKPVARGFLLAMGLTAAGLLMFASIT